MNSDILELGKDRYMKAVDYENRAKDEDGFMILEPTSTHVDQKMDKLTTNIGSLEEKLKQYKNEKFDLEQYKSTDDYKESKSKKKTKKNKKAKMALLEMVFNNADDKDTENDVDEEDEENYRDIKKKTKRSDTLDTTYGKRFSPVVALLHDSITDFDMIAADIKSDLDSGRSQSRSMYRSSQIGNLIAAKGNKLSAIKELAIVAKTVSDLEYKKEKDKTSSGESDTTKAIAKLGAKYLRSGLDEDDTKKKKKSKKPDTGFSLGSNDDDEEDNTITAEQKANNLALANELKNSLLTHKSDISLSPHERYISMEGKYTLAVAAKFDDPENTWKFVALNNSGTIIPDFKDKYGELIPKRKNCKMTFDLSRLKCVEKNTRRTYQLLLKE